MPTFPKIWLQHTKKSLSALVILVIFGVLFQQIHSNWSTLGTIDFFEHPWLLTSHLVLTIVFFVLMPTGWHYLMVGFGAKISYRDNASIWLFANLGKYIPGKVFMLAGRVELSRRLGVRYPITVSALVYEHLMHLMLTSPFIFWAISNGFRLQHRWQVYLIVIIVACSFFMLAYPQLMRRMLNRILARFHDDELVYTLDPLHTLFVALFFASSWIAYGSSGVVLSQALGFSADVSNLFIFSTFIASWMIGFVSMLTPSGIGVREGITVLMLQTYMPVSHAVALALISRFTWTCVELLGVLCGLWGLKNVRRQAIHNER